MDRLQPYLSPVYLFALWILGVRQSTVSVAALENGHISLQVEDLILKQSHRFCWSILHDDFQLQF